jgi:pilus assembly protein CpaC
VAVGVRNCFAARDLISMAGAILICCGSSLACADSKVIPDNVTLYAGQAMVQNAPGPLSRIAVGDGKVLGVKIVGKQELVMIGEKPGDTSMHLWMADGSQRSIAVHVTAGNSEQVTEAVRQMLGDDRNITVTPIGGNVVVTGSNLSAGEVANIEAIRKIYPQVLNFAGTNPCRCSRRC